MLDGRWISLPVAVIAYCLVYRESMVREAGYSAIPRDLDGFLKLCRALKAHGTPAGFALGNSSGDTTWCSWLLWAHGARVVDENNRVAINSPETIAALEYARELYATFVQGTLSWLDPSNNKAFLAGDISLTYNPISIYYVAKNSGDAGMRICRSAQSATRPNSTRCSRRSSSNTAGIRMPHAITCDSCWSAASMKRGSRRRWAM
jgi:multiple sugar transport system substrate-binding protein